MGLDSSENHQLNLFENENPKHKYLMKTISNEIKLGNILISNDQPITLIGGVNVIENKDFTYECAKVYKKVCQKLSINLVLMVDIIVMLS